MTRTVQLAVVAALSLAHAPAWAQPAAAAERASKARSSADGLHTIRLVEEGPGKCRVEVTKGQGELDWVLPRCVGTVDDLLFVANGGQRFWVLRTLPETPARRKGERRAPHFRAVVAVLYDKDGKALRTRRLADFLEYYRLGLVRQLDRHFKWLEGVYGVPGKGPRVTDDNVVQFETVAQKTHTLKFE